MQDTIAGWLVTIKPANFKVCLFISFLTGDQESALSHYITAGVAGLEIAQVCFVPLCISRV
jgi:hypothetical protein